MSERLYGKIDGEINMDLHGNITFKNNIKEKESI